MEKEERDVSGILKPPVETTEFFLQWGSRKRLRCVRVRGSQPAEVSSPSNTSSPARIRRGRNTSRFLTFPHRKEASLPQAVSRHTRNSEPGTLKSENRYYVSTVLGLEATGKTSMVDVGAGSQGEDQENNHNRHQKNINGSSSMKLSWPKLCIGLSSKEKEEDFMAMKGCRLPQRPKKRAKVIQRTLLLVSPGTWLTDLSLERYEVREKKASKKRARGLKAMGSIDSDSE